jgi:quercetin dioxygenase-like cupin family protein
MPEAKIINSWEVKPFTGDETGSGAPVVYESRMILDNILAGTKTAQINEGTLKGGCSTGGGVHENDEIYYTVKGEAELTLGEKIFNIKQGSLVFIPGGIFHALKNTSATDDFVLITIWLDASHNDMYEMRMKAWGKSFKTIYEE